MSAQSTPSGPHQGFEELIPWLVNGRLAGPEAAALRAHLDSCAECAREYQQQARIYGAMQAEDSIAFASEASFQKLAARLDAAAPAPRLRAGARWMAAASIVGALGLAAWGGWVLPHPPSGAGDALYRTLTARAPLVQGGPQLRVVFAPNLTVTELEQLLRSIDASISSGPSEAGVFTLTLAQTRDPAAQLAQSLAALRADASVRFAEPVMAAP